MVHNCGATQKAFSDNVSMGPIYFDRLNISVGFAILLEVEEPKPVAEEIKARHTKSGPLNFRLFRISRKDTVLFFFAASMGSEVVAGFGQILYGSLKNKQALSGIKCWLKAADPKYIPRLKCTKENN